MLSELYTSGKNYNVEAATACTCIDYRILQNGSIRQHELPEHDATGSTLSNGGVSLITGTNLTVTSPTTNPATIIVSAGNTEDRTPGLHVDIAAARMHHDESELFEDNSPAVQVWMVRYDTEYKDLKGKQRNSALEYNAVALPLLESCTLYQNRILLWLILYCMLFCHAPIRNCCLNTFSIVINVALFALFQDDADDVKFSFLRHVPSLRANTFKIYHKNVIFSISVFDLIIVI